MTEYVGREGSTPHFTGKYNDKYTIAVHFGPSTFWSSLPNDSVLWVYHSQSFTCCVLKHTMKFHSWFLLDSWTSLIRMNGVGSDAVCILLQCILLQWSQLQFSQQKRVIISRGLRPPWWSIFARDLNAEVNDTVVPICRVNVPPQENSWEWNWNHSEILKCDIWGSNQHKIC